MIIPREFLKRRTTYREFTARFLGHEDGSIPPQFLARLETKEAKIAAKLQPGDELWEFETGNQALAMTWALAIIRGGDIVESWIEWMSLDSPLPKSLSSPDDRKVVLDGQVSHRSE